MTLPAERQHRLQAIATLLWGAAWRFEGNKGRCPSLRTLSPRNQRRWLGAALMAENLAAQAKQDTCHQRAVINMCISTLEHLRDENDKVRIG